MARVCSASSSCNLLHKLQVSSFSFNNEVYLGWFVEHRCGYNKLCANDDWFGA